MWVIIETDSKYGMLTLDMVDMIHLVQYYNLKATLLNINTLQRINSFQTSSRVTLWNTLTIK